MAWRRRKNQNPLNVGMGAVYPQMAPEQKADPIVVQLPDAKDIDVADGVLVIGNDVPHAVGEVDSKDIPMLLAALDREKADFEMPPQLPRVYGFRGYVRRCQYLVLRVQRGTLTSVDLTKYKPRNLQRMLSVLERGDHGFDADPVRKIIEFLRKYLKTRQ